MGLEIGQRHSVSIDLYPDYFFAIAQSHGLR